MTATRIDDLLARDLAALGEASRRDLPARDAASRDAGIYRDGRAGADARRDALANERRIQLALMPLSVAQVFAHRVGRAAAGAMGVVCALAMVALVADPLALRVARWFVPGLGLNIGMCLTITSTAVLVTYVVATWIAEAWFTRRMRAAIETHDDVFRDLDELARGPLDVAQRLVRKADGWAIGLSLAGIASLAAVVGYLVIVAGSFKSAAYVLSSTSVFDMDATRTNLGPMAYACAGGLLAGLLVGVTCDREHRRGAASVWVARLGHWAVIPLSLLGGLLTIYGIARMMSYDWLAMVPTEQRFGFALLGQAAFTALATWTLLWWRRRERARVAD